MRELAEAWLSHWQFQNVDIFLLELSPVVQSTRNKSVLKTPVKEEKIKNAAIVETCTIANYIFKNPYI